jgi:protein disulfide-isomerase
MPPQNGMANPSYAAPGQAFPGMGPADTTNSLAQQQFVAQQQFALAQQQVAMAQQNAASPQMVENRFATSLPARPAINPPTAANSPAVNASPTVMPRQPVQPSFNTGQDVANPLSANSQLGLDPGLSAPVLSPPIQSAPTASMASAPTIPQTAPPRQSPQPAPTPARPESEMGLDGFCPVTLIDQDRWVQGDKRWGARHRGRLYLFQSAAAQQKFLAAPDQYSPALAGFDPVVFAERGQYAEGLRTHGIRYQDQIFMFVSEESLSRFAEAPTRYTEIVRQAIGANRKLR